MVSRQTAAEAKRIIPRIESTITIYGFASRQLPRGASSNSKTFIAAAEEGIPEMRIALPPTATGKDFTHHGRWFDLTPSGTGLRLNFGGYVGVTAGWVEGFEINLSGAVAALDIRHPGIKLPALGRFGV